MNESENSYDWRDDIKSLKDSIGINNLADIARRLEVAIVARDMKIATLKKMANYKE